MHKKIVSTCSPNNNMYWVCIQYIVKKFPDGLFLVTPYVPIRDNENGKLDDGSNKIVSIWIGEPKTLVQANLDRG